MAFSKILEARESLKLHIEHEINTRRINTTGTGLALNAERASFLFQTHSLVNKPAIFLKSTIDFVRTATETQLQKGNNVYIVLEDGSTQISLRKNAFTTALKDQESAFTFITEEIMARSHQDETSTANDSAYAYNTFELKILADLIDRNMHQKKTAGKIFGLVEAVEGLPLEVTQDVKLDSFSAILTFLQNSITQLAARDFKLISDMCSIAATDPKASFVVIRGKDHLGMAPLLDIFANNINQNMSAFVPDINKRVTIKSSSQGLILLPILWNKKFWQEVFNATSHLLPLPSANMSQEITYIIAQTHNTLNNNPWLPLLTKRLNEYLLSNSQSRDEKITLDTANFIP